MKINSALKLKHVAWELGALVAVILFIAVAHSSAMVSVQLSRLNWVLRSLEITLAISHAAERSTPWS